jgi:hypothetical protein
VRRRLATLVLGAVLAGGVAATAGASSAQRPPGSPDLAAMALAASDFSGAAVVRERYVRDPDFAASFERELSLTGTRVGRSRVVYVFNGLYVEPSAAEASATFGTLRRLLRTRAFRNTIAGEIAEGAGVASARVSVAPPRTVRVGDGAASLAIALRTRGVRIQAALTFLRVSRVLSTIAVVGAPRARVLPRDVDRLTDRSVERIRTELVPRSVSRPVVSGSPIVGMTLSTTQGTWRGDQLTFSYQWERCTGPGDECAPIPGATSATYTIVQADLGSFLVANVSGTTSLGTRTTTAAPTDVVTGPPGAPTIVTAPAIEAAGATLTATPGTWTGQPTSFAYQWRRCRLMGGCVDIAGATESAYTLTAADSGATLRVLVVATNTAGPGGVLSAPSAPAP